MNRSRRVALLPISAVLACIALVATGCSPRVHNGDAKVSTAHDSKANGVAKKEFPTFHAAITVSGAKSLKGKYDFQDSSIPAEQETCESQAQNGNFDDAHAVHGFRVPNTPYGTAANPQFSGHNATVRVVASPYKGPGDYAGTDQVQLNDIAIDDVDYATFPRTKLVVAVDAKGGGTLSFVDIAPVRDINATVKIEIKWTCSMDPYNATIG